jgi:hypothetical protein
MLPLAAAFLSTLFLAGGCAALVLAPGLAMWTALTRRAPRPVELLGPCFLLGLIPLTLLSAVLVVAGRLEGPAPLLSALGVSAIGVLAALRSSVLGPALRGTWTSLWASVRGYPAWWLAVVPLAAAELLVCAAPNTAWDAYTYHYGLVETFRRTHSLVPQGATLFEYWHLNSELLNALWMGIGGERAANAFYWVQVHSLGAGVFWGIRRCAAPFWAYAGSLIVLGLPVVVHQSGGGLSDTLLLQAGLLACLAYEAGLEEKRAGGWAAMAGLFAGYAWGVKQSAPFLLLPLAALAAWDLVTRRERRAYALSLALLTALTAAPWLARTWITTGNPFFPAFGELTRLPTPPRISYAGRGLSLEADRLLPLLAGVGVLIPLFRGRGSSLLRWTWLLAALTMLLCAGEKVRAIGSGVFSVLADHTALWRLLEDGIPPWVLLLILAGAAAAVWRWRGQAAPASAPLRRLWIGTGASFTLIYGVFPAEPRYSLFAYLWGLMAALGALAAVPRRTRAVPWTVAAAAGLATAVGWTVAGGKVWNRREVLAGTITPAAYVEARYPHLRLLAGARDRMKAGEAVLMFNRLSYRNGLPTFDGDPGWPGPRVLNWGQAKPPEILRNCRALGIRWIVVPYGEYRVYLELWARERPGAADGAEAEIRRTFPEWNLDGCFPLPPQKRYREKEEVVTGWAEMRRWLEPAGTLPGVILYELKAGE